VTVPCGLTAAVPDPTAVFSHNKKKQGVIEEDRMGIVKAAATVFYLFIVSLLLTCAPEAPRTDFIPDADFTAGNISTGYNQALVTGAAGEVLVRTGLPVADWKSVEVGDLLESGASVKTGEGACCELQLGDIAMVRIDEKTEIGLDSIMLKEGETDIGLGVELGTILCKVEKLSGRERFQVKTRSAVCGVRGTEFSVTVAESDDTVLAVKTGRVAFSPAAIAAGQLEEKAKNSDPDISALIVELGATEFAVNDEQEAVISAQANSEAVTKINNVGIMLDKLAGRKNLSVEEKNDFRAVIEETKTEVGRRVLLQETIRPERREKLRLLDSLRKQELSVVPVRNPDEKKRTPLQQPVQSLIRVSIRVTPPDAAIYLDDRLLGRGRYQGLFKPGATLAFMFEKPGFEIKTLTVAVAVGEQKSFEIKLEELTKRQDKDDRGDAESTKTEVLEKEDTTAVTNKSTVEPALEKEEFLDNFDGPALNSRWHWVRENPATWSLKDRPGSLMIKTQQGDLYQSENTNNNVLLMAAESSDFQIDTKLEFDPSSNWQQAGLVVYKNDDNYVKLNFQYGNKKEIVIGSEKHSSFQAFSANFLKKVIYLRIIKIGDKYQGLFSDDGAQFTLLGEYQNPLGDKLKVGLIAFGGGGNDRRTPAYFDYFRISKIK
jgi:regulation of enolase protein 1 (concanavalin A-like superfamily)